MNPQSHSLAQVRAALKLGPHSPRDTFISKQMFEQCPKGHKSAQRAATKKLGPGGAPRLLVSYMIYLPQYALSLLPNINLFDEFEPL